MKLTMEEYEEYPYKRVYVAATTFNYPLYFIEEIISKFNNENEDMKEVMVKIVIVRINKSHNYSFTNRDDFYELLTEIYQDYLYKEKTYYSYAVMNILLNNTND